ncbi:MAG: formate/nitrite transporter family protein [Mycobacteriales bacterium]
MATSQRLSAQDIYDEVVASGRAELSRSTGALAFSGLTAGLVMGLTGLGVAGTRAALPGPGAEFVSMLFYPLGFIAVIVGRAQLFTENTLFPVVLVLETRGHLLATLRLWVVVLVTNVVGALVFAALVVKTGALKTPVVDALTSLGTDATSPSVAHVFASAVIGGWLVALAAWLVSSAQLTIAQIAVIWLMTFPVGLLHLAHSIASSDYILVATVAGKVSAGTYLAWLGAAVAGNIVGGVIIVSLLNFGQVRVGWRTTRRRERELAEEARVEQEREDRSEQEDAREARTSPPPRRD